MLDSNPDKRFSEENILNSKWILDHENTARIDEYYHEMQIRKTYIENKEYLVFKYSQVVGEEYY